MRRAIRDFLLVVCSNNDTILQYFRDITTFAAYATACDLEKCLVSKRQ